MAMAMEEDSTLVLEALAGRIEAFASIVERYQHAVFAVALSRLGNFHEAEDVAQQVFIEAYQRLGKLADPERLGAWLRSITVNRSIDLLRRRRDHLPLEDAGPLKSKEGMPDERLQKSELREQVMAAIARLPRKQRETVTLFYINGYSIQDISEMQDTPVGSIKRRLHDARGRLKEEMLEMVEDTLKSEAPAEDFGEKVFELLSREGRSAEPISDEIPEIVRELKQIGTKGVEGLVRALQSSDQRTRGVAIWMIRESGVGPDPVVKELKQFLSHTNQGVRGAACKALLKLDLEEKRKRREFVPLVVPLLFDATRNVRACAAAALRDWARDVPLEAAARALAQEADGRVRRQLAPLVLDVLDARKGELPS